MYKYSSIGEHMCADTLSKYVESQWLVWNTEFKKVSTGYICLTGMLTARFDSFATFSDPFAIWTDVLASGTAQTCIFMCVYVQRLSLL